MIKSVYIHIPFCKNICHYCDFPKFYYQKDWVTSYLKRLKEDIIEEYQKEPLETLYIGGGTPNCLSLSEFKELLQITKLFHLASSYEFTVECNIEDLSMEKIELMKQYGVNRISLGVQSMNPKYLSLCHRRHTKEMVIEIVQKLKLEFSNINCDLMYGFPNQTVEEVERDVLDFIQLGISHISTYSLMIEPHTVFYQKYRPIDEDLDFKMYQMILKKLKEHDYYHYEISNFAKKGFESRHNITYWNNEYYYGFGLGASSYLKSRRKTITKNLNKYLVQKEIMEEEKITRSLQLTYEFILGFRKVRGISKEQFYQKYRFDLITHPVVKKLLQEKKLKQNKEYVYIPEEKLYVSNDILVEFL